MATRDSVSPLSARLRNRWFGLALGFLLLWASFAVVPVFRLPSGDLLWFPPTGVAIALALWFGPTGVLLTGLGSLSEAGFDGSTQGILLGGVNVIEALLAWVLYRHWLQGSRSLGRWRDGMAFLLTVPLLACGTAAVLEVGIQWWAGLLPLAELSSSILQGWLSRSLGAMAIAPLLLLGLTPFLMRWEWVQPECSEGRSPTDQSPIPLNESLLFLNQLLHKTNQQLQESEARFRASVETMLDCFGIYTAIRDPQGQIVDFRVDYVNDAACASNQLPRELQLGQRLCEILPGHRSSSLFEDYCRVVEQGQPLVRDSLIYEDRYGQQCLVRAFDLRAARLGDGFVATWRDVTDRRLTEEELSRHKHELKTLVENSPDIITRIDRELRHVYVSPMIEKVTGIPAQAFIGKTHADLGFPEDLCQVWDQKLEAVFASGQGQVEEFSFPAADGRLRHYESRIVPELTPEGTVQSVMGITRDITSLKQTEAAMRSNEERLRLLLESMPVLLNAFDLEGKLTIWNRECERVTGYSAAEALGTPNFSEQLYPDDAYRDRMFAEWRQRGNAYRDWLWDVTCKDGSIRTIAWTNISDACPISGFSTWGIGIDVTERQRAEAEVQRLNRELERRVAELNKILDVAPIGLAIAEDPQCQTIHINSYMRKLLNTEQDASLSKTATGEILPHTILKQGVEVVGNALPMQQAACQGCEVQNWDFELVRDDGVRFHLVGYAAPLFDEQGQVRGSVGAFVDLTELTQSATLLRENEERLRLALNAANQGLYDLDLRTGEAIVSPEYARMLGYNPEEFRESNGAWRDRLHPEDAASTYRAYEDYVAGLQSEYRVEFRQRTRSGDWLWILSLGRIVAWDEHGNPTRMLGTHTDISDRKRIEAERTRLLEREQAARQQAEAASRMKDEFLAIVSHELRSPLNGILGWARLLRSRQLDAATTERALTSIERNAQAQTQLIEDLLDISRIIRGKVRLLLRPVNLVAIIQAALDTARPAAEAKSIHIATDFDPSTGPVSGDSDRLQQVVWNLLSNAVKFTPPQGRVEVRLGSVDGYARIQVQDTGKGISAEFLPHVFDRFRQADSTTTRAEGGLGLGLAIVRNLVELHGGTVWAESAGAGQGTTFTVELALLPQGSQPSNAPFTPSLTNRPDSLAGLRVLVVDDESDTREFLATALHQYGATVMTAASTAEALSLLRRQPPDVLLSDIGMPGEDGYALIRRVRSLPPEAGGQVPAAALTAYVQGGDRLQSLNAGFQLHIPKPIDPSHLIDVVARLSGRTDPVPPLTEQDAGTGE